MVRHMFPGGNTPNGFFSYFDHILPFQDSKKTIYIKGGSGTGKSTFMHKVGHLFEVKEYDVEYFHCSNDANSLDAVMIPQLKIAIMDATAPHVQDPSAPVAIDEILNVAVCLHEDKLLSYADELRSILSAKKTYVEFAYQYLHAAYSVYLVNSSIYENALDRGKLNMAVYNTSHEILNDIPISNKLGHNRKLFASAITPSGYVNYIDTLFHAPNTFSLCGHDGCGMDYMLKCIQQSANLRGLNTETFYSPLNPFQPEHLNIPSIKISFSAKNNFHSLDGKPLKEIDFTTFCNMDLVTSFSETIQYNRHRFNELSEKAMDMLKEARQYHDRIEEIYIQSMDFEKLNLLYDSTIRRLLDII